MVTMKMKHAVLFCCGWLAFAAGMIGIFIPVLPTTPFILLATFLFSQSSPRFHAWVQRTKVYKSYVLPFKENGGIPLGQKLRILAVSFAIMGISAWAVPIIYARITLGAVALFLLYLMFIRIPTLRKIKD
jgi:uncharacterized membrane protein YbaN (DUF454 family)